MLFVCFKIFINIICKFMTFVGRNELEFFLCYRCQVFKIAVKGGGGGWGYWKFYLGGAGGDFLADSGNLRRSDFDKLNFFQS